MSRKRYPYNKPLKHTKTGTGTENIDDDPVKTGRTVVLTSISIVDETNALTRVRIGKVTAGRYHPWEEALAPAANELSFSTEEHWLRSGDYFRAQLTGGQADDVCWAYLDGYWFKWNDNPTTPPRGTGLITGTAGPEREGQPRTEEERAARHLVLA